MDYTIRLAELQDVPEILNIYGHYVKNTTVTFDLEVPELDVYEEKVMKTLKRYPWLVAENTEGKVIGYAYASELRDRRAYDFSCETTIYLHPDFTGYGIGPALYDELEGILKKQGLKVLYACICHPYPMSEDFHRKRGYDLCGHFHHCGYKFDRWLDIVWMEKVLGETGEEINPEDHFVPFSELSSLPVKKIVAKEKELKRSRIEPEAGELKVSLLKEEN